MYSFSRALLALEGEPNPVCKRMALLKNVEPAKCKTFPSKDSKRTGTLKECSNGWTKEADAARQHGLAFTEKNSQKLLSDVEGCERRFAASASKDLCCWLVLVIGLALGLLSVGMIFFVKGFFLSRDDLPYISNGRSLPFPPLFPHLDPALLYLNRQEQVYYVQPSLKSSRGAGQQSESRRPLTALNMDSFLNPLFDGTLKEAEVCDSSDCNLSWVSVTPFDRVVVLLIDALRFDFLLWDPDAQSACPNDATLECQPVPPGLRPFYRNRLRIAHDLLRRSDEDLSCFLASLLGQQGEYACNNKGSSAGQKQADRSPPLQKDIDPSVIQAHSKKRLPPNHGGNRFSRLYLFEADAPTATTQRVTGIATGSMPTFFSVRLSKNRGDAVADEANC